MQIGNGWWQWQLAIISSLSRKKSVSLPILAICHLITNSPTRCIAVADVLPQRDFTFSVCMDPQEVRRRSSPSAASRRRRSEAIASRYIALLFVLSIFCIIVSTLLVNSRLTPYFETISAAIDQPSTDTSEATSKFISCE